MRRIVIIGIMIIAGSNTIAQTYYDPGMAAEYASFWCDKRNIAGSPYFDTKWGGPYLIHDINKDCASFVSQCLIYGGLDICKGENGKGSYVKKDGVIAGAAQLVIHLTNFQDTHIKLANGYDPPEFHKVGDPAFVGESMLNAHHSLFCSSLDFSERLLYSTHTNDLCSGDISNWNFYDYKIIFFHINSNYPSHCFDCEKNGDEDEINCGGACFPCNHAPKKVKFNTPNNNLPSEVIAVEEISAGDAAIKVLSGQEVTFITVGEINLLPGFEVETGGNFSSVAKGDIHEITANCNTFCEELYAEKWVYLRNIDHFYVEDIANIDRIFYKIFRLPHYSNTFEWIYEDDVFVTYNGRVYLWDLVAGEDSAFFKPGYWYQHFIQLWVFTCQGNWIEYQPFGFIVDNPKSKSSSSDSEFDETENPPSFLTPPPNNITFQDDNSVPRFSIIPNPNAGTFQLETNFPITAIETLKITNMLGVPVYESQNVTSPTIQLPASASGQHVVVLSLKDGTVLSQKMMLQR